MKLRISAVFALFLMFALASCRTDKLTGPPAPTVSDTIAYWAFNGNLNDEIGGHNGTRGQMTFGPDRFGNASNALSFRADAMAGTETVTVLDSNRLNFTGNDPYTISAWIQTNDSNAIIIGKGQADGSHPGYQLGLSNGLPVAKITSVTGQNSISDYPVPSLSDGQWHLLTLVVNAGHNVTLYSDSLLYMTYQDPGMQPELQNSGPLLIGSDAIGSDPTGATPFLGSIDNVMILSRALDPVEVAARFHEGGWYEHADTVTVTQPGPWNPVTTSTTDNLVIGQFVNSTTGFVSGANGTFLATSDAGSTWSLRSPAPVLYGGVTIYGISFFDASIGFAVGDQREISETTDGGMTWNQMDASNVPQSDLIRSVYFTDRKYGFVGTTDAYAAPSGTICSTTDGGQTWNPIFSTNGGIYNIDFNIPGSNGANGVAQGRFGVNYWTTDRGTTWHPGSTDQANSLIARSTFISATTGFAVAQNLSNSNGYILRTDDGGHTWHTVKTISLGLSGIANNGAGVITAVGFGGVIVESTDGGATWGQSFAGTNRWTDIRYVSQHRAVLFGVNGDIDVRD